MNFNLPPEKRMNERVEIVYKRYAHPVTQFRPLYLFENCGMVFFLTNEECMNFSTRQHKEDVIAKH